jgi:exoribonuclease R
MTSDSSEQDSLILRVLVKEHTYSHWSYAYPDSKEDISGTGLPSPLMYKWFNNDLVDFADTTHPVLVKSPTRSAAYIPGVIILNEKRTYGRTANKKRLLYKCIPDDRRLPHFLVPYDMKIDFSKAYMNKYVLFKLSDWSSDHPHGVLVETLGDIDKIELFYEYQLYCNSLNSSLKEMTQKIKEMTKHKTMDEYFQEIKSEPSYKIQDLTTIPNPPKVFTIDPVNAVDYDDGLSIMECPDTTDIYVTIYIANVAFWLEKFKLWDSFDNRIATIYLPDRRRPMLPSILSETLCSLNEHTRRFALAVRFRIKKCENTWTIDEAATTIQNVIIQPYKNYAYEDPKMVYQDVNYIKLFETTVRLSNHIRNSSEMVAYWMIVTNTYLAKYMYPHNAGIYRVAVKKTPDRTLRHPRKPIVINTPISMDDSPKRLLLGEDINEPESEYDSDSSEEVESDGELDPVVKENYEKLTMEEKRFIDGNRKSRSVLCEEVDKDENMYARCTSGIRRYEDICNMCELERLMGVTLRHGMAAKEYFECDKKEERERVMRRLSKRTLSGEYDGYSVGDGRYMVKGVGVIRIKERRERYERVKVRGSNILNELGYECKWELMDITKW